MEGITIVVLAVHPSKAAYTNQVSLPEQAPLF